MYIFIEFNIWVCSIRAGKMSALTLSAGYLKSGKNASGAWELIGASGKRAGGKEGEE